MNTNQESAEDIGKRLLRDRIKTGQWLDEQEFPPLAWAVHGLIPEGFGLLTGSPKVGKSWLALAVALAVASGGPALSIPTGRPRPVLLLALEDGDRRLQKRARHLLGDTPIPELLHYVTTSRPDEIPALIAAWMGKHGHANPLVLLDTLGKAMPPAMSGEGAYGRDYRIGSILKRLVDDWPGSTLLVVHHTRKAASEDWMDSTSGTNALNGAADFTISLARPRNEDTGLLRVTGRDVIEAEYAVRSDSGRWELDGSDLEAAARAATEARDSEGLGDVSVEILAYVNQRPDGVGPKEVADALGLNGDTVRQYLGRLTETERIAKPRRGLYTPVTTVTSVTIDGLAAVEQSDKVTVVTPLREGSKGSGALNVGSAWDQRDESSPTGSTSTSRSPELALGKQAQPCRQCDQLPDKHGLGTTGLCAPCEIRNQTTQPT